MNYHKFFQFGDDTVEVTMRENEAGEVRFSAMGMMYDKNRFGRKVEVGGGQCLVSILKRHPENKQLQNIVKVWERWHLNDMHPGCEHQREFEKEPYENHRGAHCDICDYTYGTAWKCEPLPQEVIDLVLKDFIE